MFVDDAAVFMGDSIGNADKARERLVIRQELRVQEQRLLEQERMTRHHREQYRQYLKEQRERVVDERLGWLARHGFDECGL